MKEEKFIANLSILYFLYIEGYDWSIDPAYRQEYAERIVIVTPWWRDETKLPQFGVGPVYRLRTRQATYNICDN